MLKIIVILTKKSFSYIKDFLINKNSNNKYILNNKLEDIYKLKELALSNNELILVDTGNIKDIHRILANQIIKEEDLEKESFKQDSFYIYVENYNNFKIHSKTCIILILIN